jgi:uncharacterized repeat protein (TIGR03803 family)
MQGKKLSSRIGEALAIFAVTLLVTNAWAAHQVLHAFSGSDGSSPIAGLITDSAGNFYGTTDTGGTNDKGTVFELSPAGGGSWTYTVLYNFKNDGHDGNFPFGRLIFDAQGNLYGTTYKGGNYGHGTVFELSPAGGGTWTESVLHHFKVISIVGDGGFPEAGLIFDSQGNLYGTAYAGGSQAVGEVFKLTPVGGGTWSKSTIYYFNGANGANPNSQLISDSQGNLYGTTYAGGANQVGTVYELSPNGSGGWTGKVLHSFIPGSDGGTNPVQDTLVFDSQGVLYGTTSLGGPLNAGTVYKLTPNGSGGWAKTTLHNFGAGTDGVNPHTGLLIDTNGNLYGTTYNGGTFGNGEVFKLAPNGSGYTYTILHNLFAGSDASHPYGPLYLDSSGNLYGTSFLGGSNNKGTIYEITP